MNATTKKHLVSAVVTFSAVFFTYIGANITNLDTNALTGSAIAGLIIAGVRAGFKVVLSLWVTENA